MVNRLVFVSTVVSAWWGHPIINLKRPLTTLMFLPLYMKIANFLQQINIFDGLTVM
jgi:hypothetical protein